MSEIKTIPLGNIADFINGDRGKNYPSKSDFVENGIPFINAGHLNNGEIDFTQMNYISEDKFRKIGSGKTKPNDILYCLRGSLGKNAIVRYDGDAAIASSLVIIRPRENCYIKYLYHYLNSHLGNAEIKQFDNGTSQPNLSAASVKKYQIPLPPLAEQKRIAEVLDCADALREKRRRALQKLDTLLQSVFLEMFGDPVKNPKGWERTTIRDLVSSVNYGTSEKAGQEGEFPILRMNNITYKGGWDFTDLKYIDFSEKDQKKYLVRKGDILFNRTNSKELVGKTAVYREDNEMAFAGYLIRVRTNAENNPEYISAFLNSKYGKLILNNMCKNIIGMANINAQELQDIPILKPPIELQNRFASIVESVEKSRAKLKINLEKTENLFQSLQQKAFKGELFNSNSEVELNGEKKVRQQTSLF